MDQVVTSGVGLVIGGDGNTISGFSNAGGGLAPAPPPKTPP
jgi:hypothetical protein